MRARFELDYALWGEAREAAIRAARVVLNVHFYEDAALEVHRVNHLLASGACVVSEPSSDAALDAHYAPALAFAPYSAIVDTAERLARDEHARRAIANAGYAFVCAEQRACAAWLGRALSDPALAWRGGAASAAGIG